jgi:hypothetical protein
MRRRIGGFFAVPGTIPARNTLRHEPGRMRAHGLNGLTPHDGAAKLAAFDRSQRTRARDALRPAPDDVRMNARSRKSASSFHPLWLVLGLAVVIGLAWSIGRPDQPITAQALAAEMNRRVQLPRDLGDGFKLESISAQNNTIVFSTSTTGMPPGPMSAEEVRILERALVSDACRELVRERALLIRHRIEVRKELRDDVGRMLASANIRPADCP